MLIIYQQHQGITYTVRFDNGIIAEDPNILEGNLRAANCSTANSVVAKAVANARAANTAFKVGDRIVENPKSLNYKPGEKFKVGQTVYWKDGPFQSLGTIEAVVGSKYKVKDYHTNRVFEMRGDDIAYAVNSSAEPTVAKNATEKNFGNVTIEFLRDGPIGCWIRGIDADPYGKKDVFIERAKSYISSMKNGAANLEKAIDYIKTM